MYRWEKVKRRYPKVRYLDLHNYLFNKIIVESFYGTRTTPEISSSFEVDCCQLENILLFWFVLCYIVFTSHKIHSKISNNFIVFQTILHVNQYLVNINVNIPKMRRKYSNRGWKAGTELCIELVSAARPKYTWLRTGLKIHNDRPLSMRVT